MRELELVETGEFSFGAGRGLDDARGRAGHAQGTPRAGASARA
jgi:hypothetical protein